MYMVNATLKNRFLPLSASQALRAVGASRND